MTRSRLEGYEAKRRHDSDFVNAWLASEQLVLVFVAVRALPRQSPSSFAPQPSSF